MEPLNNLIRAMYQTADNHAAWDVVSEELRRFTKADKTVFAVRNWNNRQVFDHHQYGFESNSFDLYEEYYYSVDIWTSGLAQMPANKFHAHHHFLNNKRFLNSEVYTDYARQNDVRYMSGCIIDIPGTDMFAQLAPVRGHAGEEFDEDLLAQLNLLTPHFRQSLLLKQKFKKIEAKAYSREDIIDQMPDAVFALSDTCRVLYKNERAFDLIALSEIFTIKDRELTLSKPSLTNHLHKLVKGASSASTGSMLASGGTFNVNHTDRVIEITVLPFRFRHDGAQADADMAAALVIVRNKAKKTLLDETALKTHYDLTTSEIAIAQLLSSGYSPKEIAAKRNVSVDTVRTQIRSIHKKTGCGSQTQLLAKLLGGISRIS